MTGQQLFEKYMEGWYKEPGSDEREYARTLDMAFLVAGPQRLYAMLEDAEATGQRIELVLPIPVEEGPSDPSDIKLVPNPVTVWA